MDYGQIDRQRDGWTNEQRDRPKTDRQTEGQTDKQTLTPGRLHQKLWFGQISFPVAFFTNT